MLNVMDDFNRESLALEVDTSLPSLRVKRVLEKLIAERSRAFDDTGRQWA